MHLSSCFLEHLIRYDRVDSVEKLFREIICQKEFIDSPLDLLITPIEDEDNEFKNVIQHLVVFSVSRLIWDE